MSNFSTFDISGDLGLRIEAEDMKSVMETAAEGLTEVITDLSAVNTTSSIEVRLEAADTEELVVSWLNELIFLLDARGFITRKATVSDITETGLDAVLHGETFDPERHERRVMVKAATFHGFSINKTAGRIVVEVVLDL